MSTPKTYETAPMLADTYKRERVIPIHTKAIREDNSCLLNHSHRALLQLLGYRKSQPH